jgi:hypothetical protein
MLDNEGLVIPPKAAASWTDGVFFAAPSKPFTVALGVPENCLVTTTGVEEFFGSSTTIIPVFLLEGTNVDVNS